MPSVKCFLIKTFWKSPVSRHTVDGWLDDAVPLDLKQLIVSEAEGKVWHEHTAVDWMHAIKSFIY